MAQNVLITGGAGFLGINLARYLHARDFAITTLDVLPFDYADMHPHVKAITGDIRNRQAVDQAMEGIDIVVHTAAALSTLR